MKIGLIGYGEVGEALAADLHAHGFSDISAWDRLFPDAGSGPSRAAASRRHVRAAWGMHDALVDRTLVLSAVTAGECVSVARESAAFLLPGALYFDLNSVSPESKRE